MRLTVARDGAGLTPVTIAWHDRLMSLRISTPITTTTALRGAWR